MIFNRATAINLGDWGNAHSPNAPVSYPFLWDTHLAQCRAMEWLGTEHTGSQRLARNVTEALGVFPIQDIKRTVVPPLYFKSTVKRVNQIALEQESIKIALPRVAAQPRGDRYQESGSGRQAVSGSLH